MRPANNSDHILFHPWLWPDTHHFYRTADRMDTTGKKRVANPHEACVEPKHHLQSNKTESVLEVEIPGVSKDKLTVEVHGRRLSIRGQRVNHCASDDNVSENDVPDDMMNGDAENVPPEDGGTLSYVLEMRLANDADSERVECVSCKDGLLTLRIPKVVKKAPKKISLV